MNPPPSRPANGAIPYIAINGSERARSGHAAATLAALAAADLKRHDDAVADPHAADASPTATTSATPSCPTA